MKICSTALELFNTFDKVHISLILVYVSTVFFHNHSDVHDLISVKKDDYSTEIGYMQDFIVVLA